MYLVCQPKYTKKTGMKTVFELFFIPYCFFMVQVGSFLLSSRAKYAICAVKYLLIILGSLSLVLGVSGIFLPVLPTTPFLLLSAALYIRSSARLYNWLLSHKHLGPYIRNFREHKAIPLKVKIMSVTMVWLTLLYCAVFVAWVWWMRVLFIAIAIGVTVHILHYRTLK